MLLPKDSSCAFLGRSSFANSWIRACSRMVLAEVFVLVSSSPTKLMDFGIILFVGPSLFLSLSRMYAVSLSTRSWSHLYRSCDKETGHDDIRRCSVYLTCT